MVPAPTPPSIHDLEPLESGGTTARAGFIYQDHIAADFCVEMLMSGGILAAIWCEVLDDITLIWKQAGQDRVEFLQVKSNQGDTLWSIASLCERQKGVVGTSILEKSLAHARCNEPHCFRIVSVDRTRKELQLLALSLDDPDRQPGNQVFDELVAEVTGRLPGVDCDGPRGIRFWIQSTFWQIRGTQQDVENATLIRLHRYLYEVFSVSAPDHVQAVYDLLLRTVLKAANARVPKPFAEKKVFFTQLSLEVRTKVADLRQPHAAAGGPPLRHALVRAGLTEMDIDAILEQHMRFKTELRRQPYLNLQDADLIARDVEKTLNDLRRRYAAEEFPDTPLQFHERCLRALEVLHASMVPETRPRLDYLVGTMYELTNRKLHSFLRDAS